eukprot:1188251-Prorocentrum_minimum.AAC.3
MSHGSRLGLGKGGDRLRRLSFVCKVCGCTREDSSVFQSSETPKEGQRVLTRNWIVLPHDLQVSTVATELRVGDKDTVEGSMRATEAC